MSKTITHDEECLDYNTDKGLPECICEDDKMKNLTPQQAYEHMKKGGICSDELNHFYKMNKEGIIFWKLNMSDDKWESSNISTSNFFKSKWQIHEEDEKSLFKKRMETAMVGQFRYREEDVKKALKGYREDMYNLIITSTQTHEEKRIAKKHFGDDLL